jgi:hypothetical protein
VEATDTDRGESALLGGRSSVLRLNSQASQLQSALAIIKIMLMLSNEASLTRRCSLIYGLALPNKNDTRNNDVFDTTPVRNR